MKTSPGLSLLCLCLVGPSAYAQSEAQQEMMELFRSVERRLEQIDELLSEASSGATNSLEGVGAAGVEAILKRSRSESSTAIEEIDRILALSETQGPPSSSSGGGKPSEKPGQGQQGSPLDRGPQSTSRESTPEAPGPKPGEKPGEEPGDKEGPKPGDKPGGEQNPSPKPTPDPKDGGESPDPNPENTQMGEGTPTPPGLPSTPSGIERWGSLPQHAQDVFRSEGGTELPAEYRDWIDAYHRRLNRESGRR